MYAINCGVPQEIASQLIALMHAPVSVPIAWKELHEGDLRFDHFNIRNVPQRLKRLTRDPWAEYGEVRQSITAEMMVMVGYSG